MTMTKLIDHYEKNKKCDKIKLDFLWGGTNSEIYYQLVVGSPTITTWLFALGEQVKGIAGCITRSDSHSSVAVVCYQVVFAVQQSVNGHSAKSWLWL